MKVGTDGTLLGAWADVACCAVATNRTPRILDIGTGSGLIALMLAQRCGTAEVIGIDISAEAVEQAAYNFGASAWSDRLKARHWSLQEAEKQFQEASFDLIVSNPPYFVDSLKNPDKNRQTARHTDTLDFRTLLRIAAKLCIEEGVVSLVLPADCEIEIRDIAKQNQLQTARCCYVVTREGKAPKRCLIEFRKTGKPIEEQRSHLCLMGEDTTKRSLEYDRLCKDFYL